MSPFLGGGSFEIYLRDKGLAIKGFDADNLLVNLWNVVKTSPNELYDKLLSFKVNRDFYNQCRERIRNLALCPIEDPIELAPVYYIVLQCSFSSIFAVGYSSKYDDRKRYERLIEKIKAFNSSGIEVTQGSFEEVLPRYQSFFLYLDPPYVMLDKNNPDGAGGCYGKTYYRLHKGFNHELLVKLLKEHRGKFVLSYNDCNFVREAYKDFTIFEEKWFYPCGTSQVGKKSGIKGKNGNELVITNFIPDFVEGFEGG